MPASMALDHILKTRVRCTHFKQKRTSSKTLSRQEFAIRCVNGDCGRRLLALAMTFQGGVSCDSDFEG